MIPLPIDATPVERAGLNGLDEGQKVTYDTQEERGKQGRK